MRYKNTNANVCTLYLRIQFVLLQWQQSKSNEKNEETNATCVHRALATRLIVLCSTFSVRTFNQCHVRKPDQLHYHVQVPGAAVDLTCVTTFTHYRHDGQYLL